MSSWAEVEAALRKIVNESMDEDLSQHVKEVQQGSVSDVVYGAGSPRYYKRRGGNAHGGLSGADGSGSLADTQEMNHTVSPDGTLTVTNDAKPAKRGFGNLAKAIEEGYGSKDRWYSQPRPFIQNTRDILEETGSHVDVLKDSLRKKGLKVM